MIAPIKKSTKPLKIQRLLNLTLPNTARRHHRITCSSSLNSQAHGSCPPSPSISGQGPSSLTDAGPGQLCTQECLRTDGWLTSSLLSSYNNAWHVPESPGGGKQQRLKLNQSILLLVGKSQLEMSDEGGKLELLLGCMLQPFAALALQDN